MRPGRSAALRTVPNDIERPWYVRSDDDGPDRGPTQIVETVNGQLAQLFGIEDNKAHAFKGLYARLHSKLAAHTFAIYLNRRLGNPDPLRIKALAFPI